MVYTQTISEPDNLSSYIRYWINHRATLSDQEMHKDYLIHCLGRADVSRRAQGITWEWCDELLQKEHRQMEDVLFALRELGKCTPDKLQDYRTSWQAFIDYVNAAKLQSILDAQPKYQLTSITSTQPVLKAMSTSSSSPLLTNVSRQCPMLFPSPDNKKEEDTLRRQEQARMVCKCFEDNQLPKEFDSGDNETNDYIASFWLYWIKHKMCALKGVPNALYHFLKNDCHLKTDVTMGTFRNKISKIKDRVTEQNVKYMYVDKLERKVYT